jgi:hypothetical protein
MPQLPFESTNVPIGRSVGSIENYLTEIGVEGFSYSKLKDGDHYEPVITFYYGGVNYSLPFNVAGIIRYISAHKRRTDLKKITEQAERTAARQILEQVKVMFATVKLHMASVEELFLAFAMVNAGGQQIRLGQLITREKLVAAQSGPLMLEAKTHGQK